MAEGDELVALPEDRPVRVRGVQVHGRPAGEATAPGRVALNLGNIEVSQLARGVTLATANSLAVTRRIDVHLELLPGARPLRHGARVRVHHGTSEVLGRVSICATRRADAEEWRRANPGELGVTAPAGGRAFVRLRLERPAVLTRSDRVVLRAYSPPVTIGGGTVLDPEPGGTGVRRADALDRFMALMDPRRAIQVVLAERGALGLDASLIVRRGGLGPEAARSVLHAEVSEGRAVEAGGLAFDRQIAARMEQAIQTTLATFHAANPLDAGMPREALRERVAGRAAPVLFDAILTGLAARALVRTGERVARSDHRPTLSNQDAQVQDAILATVLSGGLTPPDLPTLAAAAGTSVTAVQQVVQRLVREKKLVKLDTLVLHPEALDRLKKDIQSLTAPSPGATVTVDIATFKERYGLTRKFAIPLLEWLDRERVTRRVGEKRVVISTG